MYIFSSLVFRSATDCCFNLYFSVVFLSWASSIPDRKWGTGLQEGVVPYTGRRLLEFEHGQSQEQSKAEERMDPEEEGGEVERDIVDPYQFR